MLQGIFRAIGLCLLFIVLGLLHYTLPQRDIVLITGTEIIRQDFSGWNRMFYAQADSGSAAAANRDLRLINTIDASGTVRVYRNEDTGFGWPPYLKLDSSDLQAEAQAAVSTPAAPTWVAVRHYGWRSQVLSIYPNAVSMRSLEGPDVRLIPWFNILFLIGLVAVLWGVVVRVNRWRRRRIDPLIEAVDERIDDATDDVRGLWARLFGSRR